MCSRTRTELQPQRAEERWHRAACHGEESNADCGALRVMAVESSSYAGIGDPGVSSIGERDRLSAGPGRWRG